MMPHQIYCDYLEDKGIDARLLRIQESGGVTVTSYNSDIREIPLDDAYGDGTVLSYGWHNGNGSGNALYEYWVLKNGNGWGSGNYIYSN